VSTTLEVLVPDIGDFTDVPIIEVFVKPGDVVKVEIERLGHIENRVEPEPAGA